MSVGLTSRSDQRRRGQEIDFDDYAESYAAEVDRVISFAGQSAEFFARMKAEIVDELVQGWGAASTSRVLDFGCGTGQIDRHLSAQSKSLDGVDLGLKALLEARRACRGARFVSYDGSSLPYRSGSFDLVLSSCVFHHIEPDQWSSSIREICRTLAPGGQFVVFEHNPLNPLTRLAVWRCPFDEDATLLRMNDLRSLFEAGGLEIVEARFIVFAPWRGALWDRLNQSLGWLPFGAQYYLLGRKPE